MKAFLLFIWSPIWALIKFVGLLLKGIFPLAVLILIVWGIIALCTWGNPTMRNSIEQGTVAAYATTLPLKKIFDNEHDLLRRSPRSTEIEERVRISFENYADAFIRVTVERGQVVLDQIEDLEKRLREAGDDLAKKGSLSSMLQQARRDMDSLETRLVGFANKKKALDKEVSGLLRRPEFAGDPQTVYKVLMLIRTGKV